MDVMTKTLMVIRLIVCSTGNMYDITVSITEDGHGHAKINRRNRNFSIFFWPKKTIDKILSYIRLHCLFYLQINGFVYFNCIFLFLKNFAISRKESIYPLAIAVIRNPFTH